MIRVMIISFIAINLPYIKLPNMKQISTKVLVAASSGIALGGMALLASSNGPLWDSRGLNWIPITLGIILCLTGIGGWIIAAKRSA